MRIEPLEGRVMALPERAVTAAYAASPVRFGTSPCKLSSRAYG
jgi:hypothetical protein